MNAIQQSLPLPSSILDGYRHASIVELKMVKEKDVNYDSSLSNAEQVVNMVKEIFENSYREKVVVVGCDVTNTPTVIHVVGIGSVSQSPLFVGNVIKPLLLSNSSSCFLLHNHPADTTSPSRCDIEVTKRVHDAAKLFDIHLIDHLILNSTATDYTSLRRTSHWSF